MTAAPPTLSSTRSRKKIKYCRSSLEFLDAAARTRRTPPSTSSTLSISRSGSPKRNKSRLAVSSSLMALTPISPGGDSVLSSITGRVGVLAAVTTTAASSASSNTKRFRGRLHQRLMSPESQAKLDRLMKKKHEIMSTSETDARQEDGIVESLVSTNHGSDVDSKMILGNGDKQLTSSPSTTVSVPKSVTKKRSTTKSLLEMLDNDNHNIVAMDVSKQRQSVKYRQQKQQNQQQPNTSSSSSSNNNNPSNASDPTTPSSSTDFIITPKSQKPLGNNINDNHSSKQQDISQHASYSPLDYRPVDSAPTNSEAKKHGGRDVDHDDDDENTNMLKAYVDQWTTTTTKASTEPMDTDHSHSHSGQLKTKVRGNKQGKTIISPKKKRKEEELLMDDLSSSVISSSWDSERNYHDNSYGFVTEEQGQEHEGYKYDATDDNIGSLPASDLNQIDDLSPQGYTFDGGDASWENTIQSPLRQPNVKEELEVEYGQLALLMQELEHKMQCQKSMSLIHSKNDAYNAHDSVPLILPPSTDHNTGNSMAADEEDDAQNIQKQLQFEYGRLAVLKHELKRKMNMLHASNGDPTNCHDWSERTGAQSLNENLTEEYTHLASLQRELERKMKLVVRGAESVSSLRSEREMCDERSNGRNFADSPSRDDDVAFGEMIYRQRMTQQQGNFVTQGSGVDEEVVIVDHDQNYRRKRERYPPQWDAMEYYDEPRNLDHKHRGVRRRRQASSAPKRKKKRKRRFVETITRVIHEESEEEGSSSTGGRRHSPRNEEESYYDDDDISSDGRKYKYLKRHHNLSPNTGSRMPRRQSSDAMNRDQVDRESESSDENDASGHTGKGHEKKSTNPRRKRFGYTPSSVKLRQKHKIPTQRGRFPKSHPSILESLR